MIIQLYKFLDYKAHENETYPGADFENTVITDEQGIRNIFSELVKEEGSLDSDCLTDNNIDVNADASTWDIDDIINVLAENGDYDLEHPYGIDTFEIEYRGDTWELH